MITANQMTEAVKAADRNRIKTKVLIRENGIANPFPDESKEQAFCLQAVNRSDWDEFYSSYRVKSGTCRGMLILASVATYENEVWYHVSFSLRDRIPSYEQTAWVKAAMFPPDLKALQVFAPFDEHFNLHPNCLHLWANLQRDPLPDFRTMGMV